MAAQRGYALVLAGGEGKRLMPLTIDRAKPAVPFGGNYRLVDFALSNLVNAGFRRIAVLTQYKSHSLDRHISSTWALSPLLGNYVTTVPAQMRNGPQWFAGSADAIYQNLNLVYDEGPDYICVFGGRDLPEPEPRVRRRPGLHLRLRRRPHLPDEPGADRRGASGFRRRADGGGHSQPARTGSRVRGDRDGRRRAHD